MLSILSLISAWAATALAIFLYITYVIGHPNLRPPSDPHQSPGPTQILRSKPSEVDDGDRTSAPVADLSDTELLSAVLPQISLEELRNDYQPRFIRPSPEIQKAQLEFRDATSAHLKCLASLQKRHLGQEKSLDSPDDKSLRVADGVNPRLATSVVSTSAESLEDEANGEDGCQPSVEERISGELGALHKLICEDMPVRFGGSRAAEGTAMSMCCTVVMHLDGLDLIQWCGQKFSAQCGVQAQTLIETLVPNIWSL